ncbi:hypothetical protein CGSHiR3021_01267 [Haemophilus influenzae 22.4-21]|uniref:Uncharacterized protein n=1 Tax=Haemophilus influenzae 22.4-21 TaxID=375063 RepID=A4NZR2_HAEIF|nr:hypothetical protein CGSHiR3021_01267 [Haemophilus influenzae 22.4-21]
MKEINTIFQATFLKIHL